MRALAIIVCLLVGHAVAAGVFWAFLNVPESNVLMLASSAVLLVVLAWVLSWTETTAMLAWQPNQGWGRTARRGLTSLWGFVAGALVFALFWWATARADGWAATYSGEIDAWWMSKTGSSATAWIHSALAVVLWLARDVVGVSLAVAALAAGAFRGARGLRSPGWLRAGLSIRQIGPIALAMAVLVLLPLKAASWRAAALPPTAAEVVFVATKLALIYLAANVGWALVLRAGARRLTATSSAPLPS